MTSYNHTQIGYLIVALTLLVLAFFVRIQMLARAEAPSYDSGTNLLVTSVMVFIVLILSSFVSLTVSINEKFLKIRFGWGLIRTSFALSDIETATCVKNHWYYGWGIRVWFWPYMWIYNVSGLDAVEIRMKGGKIYRIGTDEPQQLEAAIMRAAQISITTP